MVKKIEDGLDFLIFYNKHLNSPLNKKLGWKKSLELYLFA